MNEPITPARYGAKKRMSPAGIAMVVALHGAAITAVVLSKSYIERAIIAPIDVTMIDLENPPEPPPPAPPIDTQLPDPPVSTVPIHIDRPWTPPSPDPDRYADLGPTPPPPPPPPPPPQPRDPVIVRAQFADASALQPAYPSRLLRQGLEGDVTVRVHISADGRVTEVRRVSADHQLFFEATRDQALRRWRFTPETRDGRPVDSWQTHTVQFRIT